MPRIRTLTRIAAPALLALLLAACSEGSSPQPPPAGGARTEVTESTSTQGSDPSPGTGEVGEEATPDVQSPRATSEFTPTDASALELAGIEGWLNSDPLTLA